MGKKRKKSKGRKKRQQQAPVPDELTSHDAEAASDDDSASEADRRDEPAAVIDLDDDLDAPSAVIDLDDDLDDPDARADLIAAAAALGADLGDEPTASGDHEVVDAEPDTGDDSAEASDARDHRAEAEPEIEGAVELDSDAEYGPDAEGDGPLIGPDALVALSEFRQEGVATVPGELVLDLGDATSPEERDRLLAAALAHVEMQDAIYRVPLEGRSSRRWKAVIATVLFLAAILLTGLPPAFLVPDAPQPLSTSEARHGLHLALLMQAEQVEAFRVQSGRLPRSLSEVETALPGVRFVRSSGRLYQLIAYTPAGDPVIYDSASPDPSFADAAAAWSRITGDS